MFRLALMNKGEVPIARLFLELPFSLEEIEENGDKVADGTAVVKNEWAEFLTYEFPELVNVPTSVFDTCPTCGEDSPPAPTEGGVQVRPPLLCDSCYRHLKLKRKHNDEGRLERLKEWFFKNQEESDPIELAELEHEIFYLAARLGSGQFTHTAIAAQSRHASGKLKQRLDRMAGRRYIHVGLLPSGDTVGYRLPPGLSYPRSCYSRLRGDGGLLNQPKPKIQVNEQSVRAAPAPRPGLKIVIKDRRQRPPTGGLPPPPRDLGPV
ncbi:MAG: hypothetical protein KDD82_14585 [Planctomycetes bacterium]|nr:hypothetical protein [Planctomycetota bacterium]